MVGGRHPAHPYSRDRKTYTRSLAAGLFLLGTAALDLRGGSSESPDKVITKCHCEYFDE